MGLKNYEGLSVSQVDALREVVNIGAGNAATALAGVLGQRTNITVPKVTVMDMNDATDELGGPESIVSCVLSQMSGDIEGVILYFQELDFINVVLESLLQRKVDDYSELDQMDQSALIEISNIIISSYVTALSNMIDLQINLSVPGYCINMVGGIMAEPLAEINSVGNQIMMLDGSLFCGGQETRSRLMLLPSVKSLNLLLEKLGVISD